MLRLFGAALAVLAFLAAAIFIGHEAGWWLITDSTRRSVDLNRDTYGQQADETEMSEDVTTINTINVQIATVTDPQQIAALRAQRRAVLNQYCAAAGRIADPTRLQPDIRQFMTSNCWQGSALPSSPLAQ